MAKCGEAGGKNMAGEPCGVDVPVAGQLCIWHDPAQREATLAAQKRGGKTRGEQLDPLPDFSNLEEDAQTLEDVALRLARVFREMQNKRLNPKRGHGMTNALRALKEVLEAREHGAKADDLIAAARAAKEARKARA